MSECVCVSQSLYDGEDKTISIATNSENRLKNRFANICVCKHPLTHTHTHTHTHVHMLAHTHTHTQKNTLKCFVCEPQGPQTVYSERIAAC